MEAVRDSDDAARRNWIASVKHATEHTALRPLLRVIRDGLRSDWLRPWFDSERWAQELDDGPTVSSLAASLFYLDQAIVYTEVEHKAIAAEMARHANDDSDMEGSQEEEEDEEQPAPERIHIDGCRICFSAEDEAETLICDECEGSFHMYCLRPRVRTVPAGDWYCPECRQTQAIAKKQVKAAPPARGRPVKRKAEPVKATRGKAAKFNADEVEMPSLPSRTLSALSGPFELHASTFASVPPSGCHVCLEDDGEQALICDGCDGEYHLAVRVVSILFNFFCFDSKVFIFNQCLGLKAVPAGEFHCDRCIALAAHADQLVESESEQSESEAESSEAGTEVSDSEPEDEDDDEEEEDEDDD
jgi:ribosomal protein L37AE/L43A